MLRDTLKCEDLKLQIGQKIHPVKVAIGAQVLHLYSYAHKDLVAEFRAMEGAKWDGKCWTVTNCDRNWYQLDSMTGVAKSAYPSSIPDFEIDTRDLWDHQIPAIQHILKYKRVIVAYEMGMGKCLIAYRACEEIQKQQFEFSKEDIWIVGPKNSLLAWRSEFFKWQPTIVYPTLVAYTQLDFEMHRASQPPKILILDESNYIKNPGATRSKLANQLCEKVRNENGFIILLCGTPAPKDASDWWHQTEVCYPGWLRESSEIKLRNRCANMQYDAEYPVFLGWKYDELELLRSRIGNMLITGFRKDVPQFRGSKQYVEISCPPSSQQTRSAATIRAVHESAISLLITLRQISDGFFYDPETKKPIWFGNSAKDIGLRGIIEELNEPRVIIYAAHTASVDNCVNIASSLGWNVIRVDGRGWQGYRPSLPEPSLFKAKTISNENELYAYFQSDSTDRIAFIAHPASAGEALTLPAPVIIYYSNDFNGKNRMHSEERTRRGSPIIYDLICLETDRLILKNLRVKRRMQLTTLGEIEESMKWA